MASHTKNGTPKSSVLVPLYIYPLVVGRTWEPLYSAIESYPDLRFLVILNLNSGPGKTLPDENYAQEIPRLNAKANVCTVGYVGIDYCNQDLASVNEDVARYASWSKDYAKTGLGVHGIFFDETPNHFSPEVAAYLDSINLRVKNHAGIMGDRLTINNPGTSVDARLADQGPDITAVVEQSAAMYKSLTAQQWLAQCPYGRTNRAYIVHSVRKDEVTDLVQHLRQEAEYIFITDLPGYTAFGSSWSDFITAMQF